ncbi:hypothetical protein BJ322DRAFT_526902 [Thelephora terrestris]|uniref:Uncharacterized protein n=1 Tax=Thelephora terrestris TaxID=56493 RepID=A0A9P6HM01_9AGAM|nr:hypothetical protein BJ322DRAFT_526902 [Thelephora terrestris]
MQGSSDTRKRSGRDKLISTFTIAVEGFDLAKELLNITPAKEAFGSASIILTMIRDAMLNDKGYIGLGIDCAGVCMALGRAMHDKPLAELNPSVSHAITQLTDTVTKIENSIVKKRRRWKVVKFICARIDMRTINSWRAELNNIMMLFNAELALNIYNAIADLVNELRAMKINRTSTPAHALESGESPPPPPRACIGRDALIEDLVRRAEELEPSALTGTGGLGKTAIALAVLHHPRVVRKFSDRRRFIRCDEFPNSLVNFLDRISTVIGAGITNVTSLVPLRPFIEAQPMILVLDNAETILDEHTQDGTAIYQVIEELCRLRGLCLIITSRLSIIPSDCKRVEVPPLSSGAAQEIFYRIYPEGERSDLVNGLLERLDFHPLSITILATVASRKSWDYQRILEEWEKQKVKVLQTNHESLHLAASIEVSLDSPTFKNLGPKAREILGVVAFFPLGINGKKLDWLLPEVSDREDMIDTFCALSLTSRYKGFVTMLAPLREYLRPEDLRSSSLLWGVKEQYFSRLHLADEELQPGTPGFNETKWVIQEESNVEHLLETFAALEEGSEDVWGAYADFLLHLSWHKPAQNTPGADGGDLIYTPMERSKFVGSFGKRMIHPLSDNLLGQKVINRFDKVLANGIFSGEEAKRCIQVLSRMCKRQGMLPESMRVSINLRSVDARNSGLFSKTYHCEHNGNPVTVKVINACFTVNLDGVVNVDISFCLFAKRIFVHHMGCLGILQGSNFLEIPTTRKHCAVYWCGFWT